MSSEVATRAVKARGVNKYLKVPYAILILIVAFVLMALCEAIGITILPIPIAMAGVAVYAFTNSGWAFPGLSNSGTKKVFGILAPLMLLFGLAVSGSAEKQEQAQQIVDLAKTNPDESNKLLAAADNAVLENLKRLAPGLESAEQARRRNIQDSEERKKNERLAAEALAQEKANAGKIAAIEKKLSAMPKSDLGGRITAYNELVALAPSNAIYSEKLNAAEVARTKLARMDSHPEEFLELNVNWYKGGFGAIMLLRGSITNESSVDLKDFTVRCDHSGSSGTVMDSNTRVVYERVNAGQTKRLAEVNMGMIDPQAVSSSCEITNAERA